MSPHDVLTAARPDRDLRPGATVTAVGVLMALGCVGFAVVNVVFEMGDRFADGRYADYSTGLSVMNWLVTGLKVVGGAVALMSVSTRQRLVSPRALTVLLWGAFATLGIYVLGSMGQAVALIAGVAGDADEIDLAGVAYVLAFLLAASGFGVLATSYSRRHDTGRRLPVLGVLGGPVVLGLVLLAVPALLTLTGVMPAS